MKVFIMYSFITKMITNSSSPNMNVRGELANIKEENQRQVIEIKKENLEDEYRYDLRNKQRKFEQEQKSRDHETHMDHKRAVIEGLSDKRRE